MSFIGHCQACMGQFHVRANKMVLHGYLRPGTGELLGDCRGVGHAPYELSCELQKALLKTEVAQHEALERRIAEVAHPSFSEAIMVNDYEKIEARDPRSGRALYGKKAIPHDDPRWPHERRQFLSRLRGHLRENEMRQRQLGELISMWKLQPLIPAQAVKKEAEEKKAAARAARKEAHEARRQAGIASLQRRIDSSVEKLRKDYIKARKANAISNLWPENDFENPARNLYALVVDGVSTLMNKASFADKAEALNAIDRPDIVLALGLARADGSLVLVESPGRRGLSFPDRYDRNVIRNTINGLKTYFMGR